MLNTTTIKVSKVGTAQVREESESGIRKWEEMWFKTTAEDGERERGSSDVWWKTVPQTSGCNMKCSVTDSGQTSTSNVQRRWWEHWEHKWSYVTLSWVSTEMGDCLWCTPFWYTPTKPHRPTQPGHPSVGKWNGAMTYLWSSASSNATTVSLRGSASNLFQTSRPSCNIDTQHRYIDIDTNGNIDK